MSDEVTQNSEPIAANEQAQENQEQPQEQALGEQIQEAAEAGASKEEIKQMIQDFELKVNGKTINKKLDLNDKEAVTRELQKAYAGQQAMQKAAEIEKLYKDEIARLKKDPFSVLEELGLDPDELAELRIQKRIEEMKKSPEQVAKEQMQKELEEARKKLKDKEEEADKVKFEKMQEQAAREIDHEITTALDAHKTLAATPFIIKRVADATLWAMENGFPDAKAGDVLDMVEDELKKEMSNMFAQLPEEVIEAYLGQKNVERLRQKRIKAVQDTKNISNIQKETAKVSPSSEAPRPKMSIDEFMRKR